MGIIIRKVFKSFSVDSPSDYFALKRIILKNSSEGVI